MTEHSSTAMLNCGESKKYCHTVIFAGILEMNATLRSQAKYRGVAVKFLLEVGRLRLAAITSAPPCAAPYRAARETGGCSRVESCVSAASQECLHRVTTDHQQPPPLPGLLRRRQVCWAGGVGRGSGCVQAAWKAQSVKEDLWQAESQRGASLHKQEPGVGEPTGRCHNCCSGKQEGMSNKGFGKHQQVLGIFCIHSWKTLKTSQVRFTLQITVAFIQWRGEVSTAFPASHGHQ